MKFVLFLLLGMFITIVVMLSFYPEEIKKTSVGKYLTYFFKLKNQKINSKAEKMKQTYEEGEKNDGF